jgi:gamma-butyrobetaine dioxygenase/trimethyllysine dioxygenase
MSYARHVGSLAPEFAPAAQPLLEHDAGGRPLGGVVALALASVRRWGAAIVRRDPADATPPERATAMLITAIEAAGHRAVATPRGRIEDVRAGDDELHTDLPFRERPPRLVLLHCLQATDGGEELVLVDARAAFQALERADARAAGLLASVRVRFDDGHGARSVIAPLIDRDGDAFLIRGGPFVLAPGRFTLPAATALGAAHEKLAWSLHDPRHLVRVRLDRGDWALIDNHRTLHARPARDGDSWARRTHLDPC